MRFLLPENISAPLQIPTVHSAAARVSTECTAAKSALPLQHYNRPVPCHAAVMSIIAKHGAMQTVHDIT